MYFTFFKQAIKFRWAYKVNSLFGIVGTVVKIMASIYLWKAIFNSSPADTLGGFNVDEMYKYLILTSIVGFFLGSSVDFTVPYEIIEGFIAMELIKPYSYIKRHFFYDLGSIFTNFTVGILVFIGFLGFTRDFSFLTSENIAYFSISLVISYFIVFSFNMIIALIGFYTTYVWGVRMIKNTLISFLSGALIPLSFLPETWERIFAYSPFSYLSYYPTLIIMGKLEKVEVYRSLVIQSVWAIIFYISMKYLYSQAIKKLQILGG